MEDSVRTEVIEPVVRPDFTAVPAPIAKALAFIKKTLPSIPKNAVNKFGGYNYTSVDDIFAAITRLMGEIGLSVLALETDCQVISKGTQKGEVQLLRVTYQFVLVTEQATWTHSRFCRTVQTQITGPQTFQAAASFAEKGFFRSLFQLPTGDVELDAMPQGDTLEEQEPRPETKRKSSYAAKKDGTTDIYNKLERGIRQAQTAEALREWKKLNAAEISTLPTNWETHLNEQYTYRLEDLTAAMGKV